MPLARLALLPDDTGGFFIQFDGLPGLSYRLQRATNLMGPWDTIDTQTASASGLLKFADTNPPPGQAFYRTVRP